MLKAVLLHPASPKRAKTRSFPGFVLDLSARGFFACGLDREGVRHGAPGRASVMDDCFERPVEEMVQT